MNSKEERMRELVHKLNETAYAYYVLDDPVISDMQWDQLYDELKKLEEETGIVLPDSPTRKVGGEPLKGCWPVRGATNRSIAEPSRACQSPLGGDCKRGRLCLKQEGRGAKRRGRWRLGDRST